MKPVERKLAQATATAILGIDTLWGGDVMNPSGTGRFIADSWFSDEPLPKVVESLPKNPDFFTVYAYIDKRCRKDPAFKAEFLANPTDTVRKLGCALPKGTAISVHLSREDHTFINLPLAWITQLTTDMESSMAQMFAEEDPEPTKGQIECFGWYYSGSPMAPYQP